MGSNKKLNSAFRQCANFCCYCGDPLTLSVVTTEHLIPRSKGGSNTAYNVRPCCGKCNRERDNMSYEEYAEFLRDIIRRSQIKLIKVLYFQKYTSLLKRLLTDHKRRRDEHPDEFTAEELNQIKKESNESAKATT